MDVLTSCSSFQCIGKATRGRHSLHAEGKAFGYVFLNKYCFNSRCFIILLFFGMKNLSSFQRYCCDCCVSIRTLRLKMMNFPLCRRRPENYLKMTAVSTLTFLITFEQYSAIAYWLYNILSDSPKYWSGLCASITDNFCSFFDM